jgi:molybdopterin converting factor small subunit
LTFHIPGALREFAAGRSKVEVATPAATLNQALLALWTICPGMRDRVVTEQGDLRAHINIFVGDEDIRYTGGFTTPVNAESVILIVPAVSGGGESDSLISPVPTHVTALSERKWTVTQRTTKRSPRECLGVVLPVQDL